MVTEFRPNFIFIFIFIFIFFNLLFFLARRLKNIEDRKIILKILVRDFYIMFGGYLIFIFITGFLSVNLTIWQYNLILVLFFGWILLKEIIIIRKKTNNDVT